MSTLYVDHQGADLRAVNGAVVIAVPGERPRSIPLSLLQRVVLHGEATLTTSLLGRLAEAGIGVLTLSGRQSWRTACLLGRPHRDVRIRLAQYQLALDPVARASWAALWIRGKLRAQQHLLRHADPPPAAAIAIKKALETLELTGARLSQRPDLATLRGLEGAAAAAYFAAYSRLFPPALGFDNRNRRPPRDPVNAALSLAYTLLHFEAVRAAQAAGLDPLLGSLHDPAYGRESLACDLIEPLRPRVDGWIWRLFHDRTLRAEHFQFDKGACLLHKAGRRHFYEAWENAGRLWQLPLRGYARLLVRHLRQMPLPLPPMPSDWDEFALAPEPTPLPPEDA